MTESRTFVRQPGVWLALIIGVTLKIIILATGASTFDGDEAIVALMARHILQGEFPLFFYGQVYMGALDAYLIAPLYLLVGQRVLAVRIVQVTLFAGTLLTTALITWEITRSRLLTAAAGLLIAIPTPLFSTYTTASMGNYGEVLLLNNLILLMGWALLTDRLRGRGWWALLGLLVGTGWWGMALIALSIGPLVLIGLWHYRRDPPWRALAFLAGGFLIGALPWLIGLIGNGEAVIAELFGSRVGAQDISSTTDNVLPPGFARLASLVIFNLPALFGLRPPWSVEWVLLPLGVIVATLYLISLYSAVRTATMEHKNTYRHYARLSLLLMWPLVALPFLLTPFGNDPTGRYLLHLYPPLIILVMDWLNRSDFPTPLMAGLAALLIIYNGWGTGRSIIQQPPGLTTQFDLISHIPEEWNDDLITFLDSIGADRGYSNEWVGHRFAFLTGERIILAPRLPYKEDLSFTAQGDRVPGYTEQVRQADDVVYVTSNHPILDELLMERFAALEVSYRTEVIGPYTVFYDLSRHVTPEELDIYQQ